MAADDTNSTQNYVLSKSQPIDFTFPDFDSFARGESSLSFASDIESNLQVDESIHPQLEGLEEKVGDIKSELEDIAAKIAKHSDGRRLSFEVCNFDDMFEVEKPDLPILIEKKVLNKSDSIDGSQISNKPLQPGQLEKEMKDNDLHDASTERSEFNKPEYSNKSHVSDNSSNSSGGKQTAKQEEFTAGDEKMTSVVDFDELNDDENDEYLKTKQFINGEFTAKISLHKNEKTIADFQKTSPNWTNSTITANIETPNLFSSLVVNQQSPLPTNMIEKQQRESIDDVQLDCLEDKVHQIATQLDIIAEKLAQHVQINNVDKNTAITSEMILQKDVPQIDEIDNYKNCKETLADYENSKIEVHQIYSTSIIPTNNIETCQFLPCPSRSSVLLPVINTEVISVSNNENDIDETKNWEIATSPEDFATKNNKK